MLYYVFFLSFSLHAFQLLEHFIGKFWKARPLDAVVFEENTKTQDVRTANI